MNTVSNGTTALAVCLLSIFVLAAEQAAASPAAPAPAFASSAWSLRTGEPPSAPQPAEATTVATPPPVRRRFSAMVFVGPLVSARLGKIAALDIENGLSPAFFAGGAASYELARWKGFSLEAEAGLGALIGSTEGTSTPHFWSAAFLRYDRFPWNHRLRTTVAASTGASYSLRPSVAEMTGRERRTRRWLHYLAPEITFARPDAPDRELVLRLHHRSSAFGLFGCDACALNVLTLGLRSRF